MKSELPSPRCLKRMLVVVASSSLTVAFIFALDWSVPEAGGGSSSSFRFPRKVVRELLSHRRPAPNYSGPIYTRREEVLPRPEFLENRILPGSDAIYFPDESERTEEADNLLESPTLNGWTVLPGNVTVHVGKVSNPHNYSYVLSPDDPCQTFDPRRLKLLIFVESQASNVERRKAIRSTWGLLALQRALNFRIVYGLGLGVSPSSRTAVWKESYRYGDVLQENFPESFRNLALKSVMGLKWAVTRCPQADYVMKTDDDLLIHVPNLMNVLEELPRDQESIVCHENKVRRILRKELERRVPPSYGKYIVKSEDLPGEFFPPYCAGMGYVFPGRVAERLYRAALTTPYFFIEDAYVTGFCRHKADVPLSDHPAITLRPAVLPRQGGCAFRDGRITSQEITHRQMREMWEEINTRGYFCPRVIGYVGRVRKAIPLSP